VVHLAFWSCFASALDFARWTMACLDRWKDDEDYVEGALRCLLQVLLSADYIICRLLLFALRLMIPMLHHLLMLGKHSKRAGSGSECRITWWHWAPWTSCWNS